jgi:hypothetical protein
MSWEYSLSPSISEYRDGSVSAHAGREGERRSGLAATW